MPDPVNPTGGILASLPLDYIFSAPINAVIKAQEQCCTTFVNFLERVGIDKDGKVRTVRFSYQSAESDKNGQATGNQLTRVIDVPFLATIPLPNFSIDKLTEDFEMEITTSEASKVESEYKGAFSAQIGWGIFSASMSGSISHKSEQTRKTDTRAKLTIHMEASRMGAPEGLQRVLDFIMNEQIKPVPADKASKPAVVPATTG